MRLGLVCPARAPPACIRRRDSGLRCPRPSPSGHRAIQTSLAGEPCFGGAEARPVATPLYGPLRKSGRAEDRWPSALAACLVEAARHLGPRARGLATKDTTELTAAGESTLRITATPARHGPLGSLPIVGSVTGFLLEWAGQKHGALYSSGDTVWYRRLRQTGIACG